MHIVFFTHPSFMAHQSMPRYASWLVKGMEARGHTTERWTAEPFFSTLPLPVSLKKWMGYLDQYLLFPAQARRKMKKTTANTLFVFTDHALGPWVPLVNKRKHIVHCHDFLAQKSALGQVPQNPTSLTGKKYQAYIRNGYSRGQNFICISHQTEEDLLQFLPQKPRFTTVIYNAVNHIYQRVAKQQALEALQKVLGISLEKGFLMHVGGNQWYKNRVGAVLLYNAWKSQYPHPLPLLLIGEQPDARLQESIEASPFKDSIFSVKGLNDATIIQAYNTASLLLFPSLAEGFGWPIAEAMACGCPVLTTGKAPMTEVGGDAAFYIPEMPLQEAALQSWLHTGAHLLEKIISLPEAEKKVVAAKGIDNIKRFDSETQLDKIAAVYEQL